jgi:hypothetical protein
MFNNFFSENCAVEEKNEVQCGKAKQAIDGNTYGACAAYAGQ